MLTRLRRYIRSFFDFSHAEATGFLIMVFLLLLASVGWLLYRNMPGPGYTAYAADKALLDSLVLEMEALEPRSGLDSERPSAPAPAVYFPFNPNLLPADSLALLGMPPWLARRIVNYRQKGGQFRKKEDLLKIYDFPDSLYQALDSYIRIAPAPPSAGTTADRSKKNEAFGDEKPRNTPAAKVPETIVAFDINQVDSLQLQQVRGIGPVLSGRIVKFRERLGGFTSLDQLYEVWGLDSAVVSRLQERAYVEEGFEPQNILLINSASQNDLAAHPYINPSQARLIYNYRQQHGPFRSVEDLRKIHILDAGFVQKIAPYIRLE